MFCLQVLIFDGNYSLTSVWMLRIEKQGVQLLEKGFDFMLKSASLNDLQFLSFFILSSWFSCFLCWVILDGALVLHTLLSYVGKIGAEKFWSILESLLKFIKLYKWIMIWTMSRNPSLFHWVRSIEKNIEEI